LAVFDEAASDVLKQDTAGALKHLRDAGQDPKFAGAASELAAAVQFVQTLGTAEERILKSFSAQIGETVKIEMRSGVAETYTVVGTAGDKVRASRSMGAATIEKQLGLADLSLNEKQQRIGEGKKPELLVMRGSLALEAKDLAGAQALFAEAATAEGGGMGDNSVPVPGMASAIARVAEQTKAEGRENAARQALQALIQLTGLIDIPAGRLADVVGEKGYAVNKVKKIRVGVADFRKQHAETTVAKENAALLDALAAVDTQPTAMKVDLGGDVTLEMVWIKPGKFMMGSAPSGRELQHEVTLTKGFWMGKYEVTQAQWEQLMGNNPSNFKKAGKDAPVECVSWNDCQEFLKNLNARFENQGARIKKGKFRLPTEAEWEYACRAGTKTRFCSGDADSDLDAVAWFNKNADGGTHPVGQKKPNAWGIYDMHGNVMEWCQDWFGGDYSAGAAVDPNGPSLGDKRVLRGGCWTHGVGFLRSADHGQAQSPDAPGGMGKYGGFRLARD
jgi:formylglycine-generating enzyme required for sulfatase activity